MTHNSTDPGLLLHAAIASAVALLGLVAAFLLLWWQVVVAPVRAAEQAAEQQLLQQYTRYLNTRLADLRATVDAMATASATASALLALEPAQRTQLSADLAEQHPHVERVAIIEKGKAEVDLNASVPISFAALDLIRRAETRAFVGPEAGINQGGRLYAAQPITIDGTVRGVLLAIFSPEFLTQPLLANPTADVQLQILQSITGTPTTAVLNLGDSKNKRAPIAQDLNVPHWQASLAVDSTAIKQPDHSGGLWMPFALAALFIIAGAYLAFSRFSRKMSEDVETLSGMALRLIRGRDAAVGSYHLSSIARAAAALQPQAAVDAATPPDTRAPDASAPSKTSSAPEPAATPATVSLANASGPQDNFGIEVNESGASGSTDLGVDFDPNIFRAYDIRGITSTNLTEEVVYWIGRAFAAEALDQGQQRVAVGRDGRNSGPGLQTALMRGLSDGGADVINIGAIPTPVLYYATHALDTGTGIMITGSHNPPEYNGLKMMIGGVTLAEDMIQNLYRRLLEQRLSEGAGQVEETNLNGHYIDKALEDVAVAQAPKVVVDCGNGIAGVIAPQLLRAIGCEVIELYCDVDGNFPNHHPDPAEPENLEDLITVVAAEQADLGLAFDGDGDRLGVVTNSGQIIWPDKMIMLFAQDIVSRNPGADIIYDVKCSRHLNGLIGDLGGRPIMWKTGHSHMKAKIKETGALLAGEFSGHICFGERWYGFDDALYTAVRLLEILGADSRNVDEVFAQFPQTFTTPEIKINTSETEKFSIMQKLEASADWGDGTITSIDGIRVDYADGWGLIRPSNTSPVLSLRFEADNPEALERIQDEFQARLSELDANLNFR